MAQTNVINRCQPADRCMLQKTFFEHTNCLHLTKVFQSFWSCYHYFRNWTDNILEQFTRSNCNQFRILDLEFKIGYCRIPWTAQLFWKIKAWYLCKILHIYVVRSHQFQQKKKIKKLNSMADILRRPQNLKINYKSYFKEW